MKYAYDIVIIGGGSGGLVVASSTAQLGLRVLLIEKERLGGDCLWYGCVPSKALIAVGKRINEVHHLSDMGLPTVKSFTPAFENIMKRMRAVQQAIAPHDSPERFRGLGADVEFGEAHFVSKHELLLGKKRITFKYGVISTGSSPRLPEIPGLRKKDVLTNVEVFSLKKMPRSLVVIGGGPIGVELAQAFNRFGSKVTMVIRGKLLGKEDQELVAMLSKKLEAEGITLLYGWSPTNVEKKAGKTTLTVQKKDGKEKNLGVSEILVAAGRQPNIEGLQLEQAGISYTERGIVVDKYLRTSAKNIFAVGDVTGGLQFTHMAASHASTAVRNIITPFLNTAAESVVVPWVTYTDPELARVGMNGDEAKKKGVSYEQLTFPFDANDRAIAEDTLVGEIRVIVTPKGKILGATILGPNAGELIMEYALAMKHGLSIKDLAATIHPYPTLSGASWSVAGSFYKKFLTPRTKKLTKFLVRWF